MEGTNTAIAWLQLLDLFGRGLIEPAVGGGIEFTDKGKAALAVGAATKNMGVVK